MKKSNYVVFLAVLMALPTYAGLITSVTGSDINTNYEKGTLTICDTINLVIQYDNQVQTSYVNATFMLTANLIADNGDSGVFGAGSYTIRDNANNDLLSGQIQNLLLVNLFDGRLLSGPGQITLDTGLLLDEFPKGAALGKLVNITYRFNPGTFNGFSESFIGSTNATIQPIPEPATLLLLGLGGLLLARRKVA